MKLSRLGALLAAFAFAAGPAGAEEPYRVSPSSRNILGFPVAQLDRQWERASVVNEANLPPMAKDDLGRATDTAFRFVLEGDWNGDGRPDKAVAGVYRTRSGDEGQFLLVVTRSSRRTWAVAYLSKYPGFAGPSLLYASSEGISWVPCTACDFGATVSWMKDHYETTWDEAE